MAEPEKRIQFFTDTATRERLVRYAGRYHLPRSRVYQLAARIGAEILTAKSTVEILQEKENHD